VGNAAIELHDSRLEEITWRSTDLVLAVQFYVHSSEGEPGMDPGRGWSQRGAIILSNAMLEESPREDRLWVIDGLIAVGEHQFADMVPLPFSHQGATSLRLSGGDGVLHARGTGIDIRLDGEPELVEDFNWRLR
jgi:hypothetical protein